MKKASASSARSPGYAQLSQAAMEVHAGMIADNVQQWKRAADGLRNS